MTSPQRPWDARTARSYIPLVFAAVLGRFALPLLLLHPAWDFHRDELLYFAMGDHLALWTMQFPPLLPAVAAAGKAVFGESVLAARVPAAMGVALLLLPMLLAVRALGGRTMALVLTALATVAAPVFLRASVLLQPVGFDQAWAAWALLGVLLALLRGEPRWWLLTGAAFGLGLLTKLSAPVYGLLTFATALALPEGRRQLGTRWPWLAAALALLLGAPSVIGQQVNGWPFLAQLAVLREHQLSRVSLGEFLGGQGLMLGAAGLLALFGVAWAVQPGAGRTAERAPLRALLLFAVLLLGWYAVMQGKPYYAAPAWPMLIAAGATWAERRSAALARRSIVAVRAALAVVMVAGAAILLPMGVPCLPPAAMARYAGALGAGTSTNYGTTLTLPQDYADMLGWRDQVEAMARAFHALPAAGRSAVATSGGNYGQVGAVAMYGPARGLPYPISTRSDFWAWGTRGYTGDPALVAVSAGDEAGYAEIWGRVEERGAVTNPWRVEEERDVRILLLQDIRVPLEQLWRERGPGWD